MADELKDSCKSPSITADDDAIEKDDVTVDLNALSEEFNQKRSSSDVVEGWIQGGVFSDASATGLDRLIVNSPTSTLRADSIMSSYRMKGQMQKLGMKRDQQTTKSPQISLSQPTAASDVMDASRTQAMAKSSLTFSAATSSTKKKKKRSNREKLSF